MTAPPLSDPFEREHLLFEAAPLLRFSQRAFEVPLPELLRWLGLDVAAGVPRELGVVQERLARVEGEDQYTASFYQLGPTLAITTEILEGGDDLRRGGREHRVIELLGVKEDLRVRLNLTRVRAAAAVVQPAAGDEVRPPSPRPHDEPSFGQVRVWGGEPGAATRARASIARQLRLLGVELEPTRSETGESLWVPPFAERIALDPLPGDDVVIERLVGLARDLPSEGGRPRPARRVAGFEDRVKRGLTAVHYRYELHRAGTSVVHARRREVESGPERPGLVRTFNAVGLRGGGRVRIREVAGRAVAELAGSRPAAEATLAALRAAF